MQKGSFRSFVEAVQKNGVVQPSHAKKFTLERWRKEYLKYSNPSLADTRLYEAGIWFYGRFSALLRRVAAMDFGEESLDTLTRVHCGLQNHDAFLLQSTSQSVATGGVVSSSDLIQMRFPLVGMPEGASPDSILETGVDALKISLDSLNLIEKSRSRERRGADVCRSVHEHVNLAAAFDHLLDLWNECLWLGSYVDVSGLVDVVIPKDYAREQASAVARYRISALTLEISTGWVHSWRRSYEAMSKIKNQSVRTLKEIQGSGPERRFKYGPLDPDRLPVQDVFRHVLEELFFAKMIDWPLPDTPAIRLEMLLDAWAVLAEISEVIYRRLSNEKKRGRIVDIKYLLVYAVTFSRKELLKHLCYRMKIGNEIAEKLLAFFIRKNTEDGRKQEIWHRPFIELENGKLLPVLGALSAPNLMRSVEGWMASANIDLAERGFLFETYARDLVSRAIQESAILRAGAYNAEVNFSANNTTEQIDLVLWIGNVILVGELKCIVYPASGHGRMNFRATVDGAVEQAKRKVKHVSENLAAFVAKIGLPGDLPLSDMRVYPVVILNSAVEVGTPIDGVPVVDLKILCRYFDAGEIARFVEKDGQGRILKQGEIVRFYDTAAEAEYRFFDYLLSPPQLEVYKSFVVRKVEPLLSVEAGQKPAGSVRLIVELPVLVDC